MKPLEFDLTEQTVEVKIGGALFSLTEANGEVAVKYRDKCIGATRFKEGSPDRVEGIAQAEPFLVSLCLRFADSHEHGDKCGKLVPLPMILGWPARVQKGLYDAVMDMSDLREQEEDVTKLEARLTKLKEKETHSKNSSSSTDAGSS